MEETAPRRVLGLDVMRAVAIGLVVLSHAVLFFPKAREGFLREWQGIGLLCGYLGVELFFVLSGFLIGGILLSDFEKKPSLAGLRHFWVRRWFRTLPNYFLFLGVNVALAMSWGKTVPPLGSYLVFLQNFTAPPPSFFVESWSLAVEEWFYLLLPVAVLMCLRLLRMPLKWSVLMVAVVMIVGVSVAREMYVAEVQPKWLLGVRVIASLRLDACMYGVLGAWLVRFGPAMWARWRWPLFFGGVFLLSLVVWTVFDARGGAFSVRTTGFTVTSLGALCLLPVLAEWRAGQGWAATATTRISLWSYSLYLVNWPVFMLCSHFYQAATVEQALLMSAVFIAISVAVSALIYQFFERPIFKLRDRLAPKMSAGTVPSAPGKPGGGPAGG